MSVLGEAMSIRDFTSRMCYHCNKDTMFLVNKCTVCNVVQEPKSFYRWARARRARLAAQYGPLAADNAVSTSIGRVSAAKRKYEAEAGTRRQDMPDA